MLGGDENGGGGRGEEIVGGLVGGFLLLEFFGEEGDFDLTEDVSAVAKRERRGFLGG